ncbi:MAG: orotidine-5'-phosphate decarboxylase [Syntrophaceae bacterium]
MALRDRIIFALDVGNLTAATVWIHKLGGLVGYFKVGMELFTATGPEVVARLHNAGIKCFLDLKFHDIPNTVAGAVRSATRLGVDMMTIHLSGGKAMAEAALAAAADEADRLGIKRPKIIGVSVLTSLSESDMKDIGWHTSVKDQVERLLRLAALAGLDGMVCSAADLGFIRNQAPQDFLLITPGIRPSGAASGDQARIATPGAAIKAGADLLVIGRPISEAPDAREAVEKILTEMA